MKNQYLLKLLNHNRILYPSIINNNNNIRYYSDNKNNDEFANEEERKKYLEQIGKKYDEIYKKYTKKPYFKTNVELPPDYVDVSKDDPYYNLKRAGKVFSLEMNKTWNKLQDPFQLYQGNNLFPTTVDVLIIGGGAIGSSTALFLKQRVLNGARVAVVDRDFTVNYDVAEYARASTCLSVGGLRHQFSLKENIEMSLFGSEFLRNIKTHCHVKDEDDPNVNFAPNGYLFCANDKGAEQLKKNHLLQMELGAKNELLTPKKLKEKFPWLNTDGISLACLGLEKEGWFDPWLYLNAVKKKAISLGAEYVKGEVVNFVFKKDPNINVFGYEEGEYHAVNKAVIRDEKGDLRTINFAFCVVAAGAFSGEIAKLLHIGDENRDDGYLFVPLPVEPRKRYVYCFECPKGPGVNTPMVIDTSNTYFRREGLGNYYICGKSPKEDQEPSVENLEVDYDFFNEHIWPDLANRVKAFEELKVSNAWAGYYDFNYFDENAILGAHPGYHNIYFATGFSGHGIQQAPAVGRAMTELLVDGNFQTIDLSRFLFQRIVERQQVKEANIV